MKGKSKKIKKDRTAEGDDLAAHIARIREKSLAATKRQQEDGLDITPRLAFNKKKNLLVMKERIKNSNDG